MKIQRILDDARLDGLIVSSAANISYLTGFLSRDSYLLLSRRENTYFTDLRYTEETKKKLKEGFSLYESNGSVFEAIAGTCLKLKLKRIGFEERNLACAEYKKIKENLNKSAKFIPTHSLIENLRQIKTPEEVKKIKKALRITAQALSFIEKIAFSGKSELELSAEIERFIKYKGAGGTAFSTIVASGANSSFPHHLTSTKKINPRQPLLIDLGADFSGYKSDLTRVLFSGRINPLVRKIYNIVLRAQDEAIKKVKPGVKIAEIDASARQYIAKRGYSGFFTHNLGHGVGLQVHEEPHISANEESILKPGMVFTLEPAIYLPGRFGIRIEDMILVTKKGCEVLSGAVNK